MPRLVWKIAGLLALLAIAATAWYTVKVHRQAFVDEAHHADVIVVLGAAQYRGRPSPVLRARLDHALALFRKRVAPWILTTGGAGGDPIFTEGEVGRTYLLERNVPVESIVVEPEATSTAQSTAATREIMQRMHLRSCVIVTDGYHIFRVKKMLEDGGLTVYGSPRDNEEHDGIHYWWLCARQASAYLLWKAGFVI